MAVATKACAAYIRVSDYDQNEASQRDVIQTWLTGHGINPASVTWYLDKGKSGDTMDSPAFAELQQAIFMGSVGTVLVYKLDRLSRSLRDGINVLTD
jgi:DNA invertase Pin-like site-specific DNA recombinase